MFSDNYAFCPGPWMPGFHPASRGDPRYTPIPSLVHRAGLEQSGVAAVVSQALAQCGLWAGARVGAGKGTECRKDVTGAGRGRQSWPAQCDSTLRLVPQGLRVEPGRSRGSHFPSVCAAGSFLWPLSPAGSCLSQGWVHSVPWSQATGRRSEGGHVFSLRLASDSAPLRMGQFFLPCRLVVWWWGGH